PVSPMPPVAVAAALAFSPGFWPDAGGFWPQVRVLGAAGEAGLGDEPELAGAGGGLGGVGRAGLAGHGGDGFFDGGEGDREVAGDPLVGCAGGEQVQHLQFAGGERLGQARDTGSAAGAGLGCAAGGRGCPQDVGEVAEGYLPGGGLPVPVHGGYLAEQG